MQTVECPSCKGKVEASAFLSACSHYWSDLNVVRFTCPACGECTDAQVENSRVSLGYVYAAGAPHFCGVADTQLDGLSVHGESEDLVAELDGTTWRIRKASD
jgi:hypothetical protein